MKHNVMATASAAAITVAFIYIACAFLVALFPELFRTVASSWFHGWNMEALWTAAPRPSYVLGLVSSVVSAWLVGYLFAWTYNKFVK